MSIGTIVTRGYGSFTTIGDLVTAGFASGDDSVISDQDAEKIALKVWERVIDGSLQAQQIMRILGSGVGGVVSGMDSNAPVFKALNGTKDRITAATDKNGNRITITLDVS